MTAHALHPGSSHFVTASTTAPIPSVWPHPGLPLPVHKGELEDSRRGDQSFQGRSSSTASMYASGWLFATRREGRNGDYVVSWPSGLLIGEPRGIELSAGFAFDGTAVVEGARQADTPCRCTLSFWRRRRWASFVWSFESACSAPIRRAAPRASIGRCHSKSNGKALKYR